MKLIVALGEGANKVLQPAQSVRLRASINKILCEYRLAPGAIRHAGTERAGLRVRSSRRF